MYLPKVNEQPILNLMPQPLQHTFDLLFVRLESYKETEINDLNKKVQELEALLRSCKNEKEKKENHCQEIEEKVCDRAMQPFLSMGNLAGIGTRYN